MLRCLNFITNSRGENERNEHVMSFRTTKRRYQIKVQFFLRISIKTNVVLYTVSTLREKEFAQTPLSFSFSLFLSLFLFVRRRSWGLVVATNLQSALSSLFAFSSSPSTRERRSVARIKREHRSLFFCLEC